MPKLICFVALLFCMRLSAQNDSILQLAASSKTPDTLRAKIYGDLSFGNRFVDPEKARTYALESLKLAEKSKHKATLAQSWNDLGIVYFDMAMYDSALICYDESMKLRSALGDLKNVGGLYNKIGIVHQAQGHWEEALAAQFESLRCYDSLKWDHGIAQDYNNIAVLYFNMKETKTALDYYRRSAEIKLRIGDRDGYGGTLVNMGNIYVEEKKYQVALDHFHTALQFIDTVKNKYYLSSTYNVLGSVYGKMANKDSALHFGQRALKIRQEMGDKKGLASSLSLLGNLYVAMEGPGMREEQKLGFIYLQQALELSREIGARSDAKAILLSLAAAHYRVGEYKEGYDFLKQAGDLNDSLFSEDLSKTVGELQVKYETEKQIRENLELKASQEKAAARMRWILMGIAILILLALLAFQSYRARQKRLTNERIRQLEQKSIREILETEEKERGRIARELHDGISQLIVSAKMHVDSTEITGDDGQSLSTASALLKESLDEVRNVSHDLLPTALVKKGLREAIKESINRANAGKITVTADLRLETNPAEETALALYRIYQECLGNMLKYSGATEVRVELYNEKGMLVMKMADNGKGFDTQLINDSKGLGWDNIRFRTSLLGGGFNVASSKEEGTAIRVEVPL